MTFYELDTFTQSYIETAMWSSIGEDGEPLDEYSVLDIDSGALGELAADCAQFQDEMYQLGHEDITDATDAQLGHDFWLTRNGHGAGFWDGDYPEPLGDELTKLAKSFGTCDLYVGDDGDIYCN